MPKRWWEMQIFWRWQERKAKKKTKLRQPTCLGRKEKIDSWKTICLVPAHQSLRAGKGLSLLQKLSQELSELSPDRKRQ